MLERVVLAGTLGPSLRLSLYGMTGSPDGSWKVLIIQRLACSTPKPLGSGTTTLMTAVGQLRCGCPEPSAVGVHRGKPQTWQKTSSYPHGAYGRGETGCEPANQAKEAMGMTKPGLGGKAKA